MNTVHYRTSGNIAVIVLDNPPVNALGRALRTGLLDSLKKADADPSIAAIVIIGSEKAFCGGADIKEFGTALYSRELTTRSMNMPDTVNKVLVAAIGGFALGGGLELALCCHYRVANRDARLGLPEVKIGRSPGSGGTQRLPRLIGVEEASRMLLNGELISTDRGRELGLIDEIIEGDLLEGALRYTQELIAQGKPLRRLRDTTVKLDNPQAFFAEKRAELERTKRGFSAPFRVIECIEAAVYLPFDEGKVIEDRCSDLLRGSDEDKALRHLFSAERAAAKIPDLARDTPIREIHRAAVLGNGLQSMRIAMCFADAGIHASLIGETQQPLNQCLADIRSLYESEVAAKQLKAEEMHKRMALISAASDLATAAGCEIIVEEPIVEPDSNRSMFNAVSEIADPHAIIAAGASSLALGRVAATAKHPDNVIGVIFSTDPNNIHLLEIVRGEKTASTVLASLIKLGKRLGKIAVVSRDFNGIIGSRILRNCRNQAMALIEEGAFPYQIDKALEDWGLAMGPFYRLEPGGSGDTAHKTLSDGAMDRIIAEHGCTPGDMPHAMRDEEILERILLGMANEGARLLEEGVALKASDIDVVLTTGHGFPRYRGGPMFHADTVGLASVLTSMERFESGYRGELWTPAALLRSLAAEGKTFNAP